MDNVRKRAIRGRVWLRALDGLERGILSLSIQVLDGAVKISCLGVELAKIIAKIEDALKSIFERLLDSYGLQRAGEVADMAIRLGYDGAQRWLDDPAFARYVTLMSLNMPVGWRF